MKLFQFVAAGAIACAAAMAQAQDTAIPEGYPASYAEIIEGSKSEDRLLIYSNMNPTAWSGLVALMNEKYPWITIETTDDNSLWEKYFAESGAGVRTADMLVDSALPRWSDFAERDEQLHYASPEIPNLPDFSLKSGDGIYAFSFDPYMIAYNRRAWGDNPPRSIADVVAAYEKNPDLPGNPATYSPERELGLTLWNTWAKRNPDAKELLMKLGKNLRPDTSAGTMREKITTGEYSVALFTSGAGIYRYEEPAIKALAGYGWLEDGTPIVQRSAAITKVAQSPNSAKLLLDLALSKEGQLALAEGGLTPYRADIAADEAPYASYNSIADEIGVENMVILTPDPSIDEGSEAFMEIWNAALGR
jgi:iron(III) transport system substrate-binding protein